jgi:hypothetical protein
LDEATIGLLVTVFEQGTRALVMEGGIPMRMGILIPIFPLTKNRIPASNPKFMLMDMIPGPPSTPSKDMGTTRLLEIVTKNAGNVASDATETGNVDAATGIPNPIRTIHPHPNLILTLPYPHRSRTWFKKLLSSKMTNRRVIL